MLAIHNSSGGFSRKWIEYCKQNHVPYKIVNCYQNDIVDQLQDCNGLMWHWELFDNKAALFARQLSYSLEIIGKKVFPSTNTSWHYDDKVGQKYLLEAINAPLVPSYVFYDKQESLNWAKNTIYPKVFKLRGGAGSQNVQIVKNYQVAYKLIEQAFGRGFASKNRRHLFTDRVWQFRRDKSFASFLNISKGIGRLFIPTEEEKNFPKQRNYIYFQDFIPGNDSDIRVIVIGNRAFAIKRMVRSGDFRASGSGDIIYERNVIPIECIKLSFDLNDRLKAQSIAYDFVFNSGKPLLVEISYCFARKVYCSCPGYWNNNLEWIEGAFAPEYFMIEDFIESIDLK